MESSQKNNNNNHRRGVRPSVGYLLFQYQSELTRRHAEPTRLSKTKIHIIDTLVSKTIRHLKYCTVEELQACKRGLVYKEQLRDELRNMRRRKTTTDSTVGFGSKILAAEPIKPPPTPPKPKSKVTTRKVVIFGPEIFV